MTTEQKMPERGTFWWLRDIHRFEHTIKIDRGSTPGNNDSWGKFLDRNFVTESGDFIGDKPEVKALEAVWAAANRFHAIEPSLLFQAEQTCNVIAALNDVAAHDAILDDAMWEIVTNMQSNGKEACALKLAIGELENIQARLKQNVERVRGVFRPSHSEKIEGRLARFAEEQEAMIASFKAYIGDFALPQTANDVRQYVLKQLALQLDSVLEAVTPLLDAIKDAPLPEVRWQRIISSAEAFRSARAQVEIWHDHPSRKFDGTVKRTVLQLLQASNDLASLKDESYHDLSKLGAVFFNRAGVCKNPYS